MSKNNYYLAGANTCQGFISKFNEINIENGKEFKYILKGGPGTGKSTLLKKVADYFAKNGYSVEIYYCSSDINSLDGVRIVEKNVCVVDGTAPHEQDASLPNINAKIFNLGEFVNDNVIKYKTKIKTLLLKKQQCFKEAYRLLLNLQNLMQFEKHPTIKNINTEISNLIKNCDSGKNCKKGSLRTVFFDYFNEKGKRSVEKQNAFKIIYIKNDQYLINKLKEKLLNLNFNLVEVINVSSLKSDGLIIPNQNLYFKVKHNIDNKYKKIINDISILVGEKLSHAKLYHKQIEKFFIANMNFKKLDILTLQIIGEIESRAN